MTAVHDHPWPALEAAARDHGDRPALIFPHQGARLTFADWHRRAAGVACGLQALGIGRDDPVALLGENRWEWAVVQLAVAAIGARFVPLNSHYRRDDLAYALRQSGARLLIASHHFRSNPYLETAVALRPELAALEHIACLDDTALPERVLAWSDIVSQPIRPLAGFDPDAIAALLYTSGTTGAAKGALLTHRGMMMCAREAAVRIGIAAGDTWTSIIPLFHCAGCIMNLLGCLATGAAYAGVPAFDPVALFEIIEKQRCTHLSGVPTSWLAMLDHPRRGDFDLTSLKGGTCGGADADPAVLRRCADAFPVPGLVQVYGQTESSTLVTAAAHDDPERLDTAGPPLPGHQMRIADPETLEPLPAGTIGEIQARGAMVMAGYHAMPDASAETITADGWLRTGDLGYLTPSGRLVVAGGRLRDMIIRGGENIYPAEIEALLQSHPAIAAAAVFAVPDEYYGEAVGAAVVPRHAVSADDIRDHCRARIAGFKIPAHLFRVTEFPLTPSGKVRKVELRARARRGLLERLP